MQAYPTHAENGPAERGGSERLEMPSFMNYPGNPVRGIVAGGREGATLATVKATLGANNY